MSIGGRVGEFDASMAHVQEKSEPFCGTLHSRKTSAEIVSEARRSLRTVCTQRPFTPKDEQRRLFSQWSPHTAEGRPPSVFSLHARHFEGCDSRPGSGKRLSPLEHVPKLPASLVDDDGGADAIDNPAVRPHQLRKLGTVENRQIRDTPLGGFSPPRLREEHKPRGLSPRAVCSPAPCADATPQPSGLVKARPGKERGISRAEGEKTVPWRPEPPGRDPSGHLQHIIADVTPARAAEAAPREGVFQEMKGEPLKKAECVDLQNTSHSHDLSQVTSHGAHRAGVTESGDSDCTAANNSEEAYWNTRVLPLLQELDSLASDGAVESLCHACDRLHGVLAERGLLGRKCRKRPALLRSLFKLIDVGSDRLSLQLSKLALALSVSGKNLLNVCKLIFRISRNDSNDALFQNNTVIDSLLSLLRLEDVWSAGEALLYCMGSLKFLSGNPSLLRELQDKGAVPALLALTRRLNEATEEGQRSGQGRSHDTFSTSGHILLQLTAALRNLSDLSESRAQFLRDPGLPELCDVLRLHAGDRDLCTNVARIFSKLSSYHECCVALAACPGCSLAFSELLIKHKKHQDLVVRILFTLGNLTAKSERAAAWLSAKGSMLDVLLDLFPTYGHMDSDPQPGAGDILAKLTRVLANAAVHPGPGRVLAADARCVELLLEVLEHTPVERCEELAINTAAAINNLSFYQGESSVVRARPLPVARLMMKLLLSSNMDCVLEATRVLGNLSQAQEVRDFVLHHKAHCFVVTLLDSKRQELCYGACGVLTNLTADRNLRAALRGEGAVQKLLDCVRDWGAVDWPLAGLACQALWNLSEDGAALSFGTDRSRALLLLLQNYLEADLVLQWCEAGDPRQDAKAVYQGCWEMEFRPVAQRLKDRLQNQLGVSDHLAAPS
ncbi:armadillo repeat-containing protein 2 [Scleropages formosus]|uniref:Armadillo repeat containing 2 n=1 Tax=Scleropages formosus TaxID=113540 RepID=A0A8C9V593_SCLFO|nr:armadillo repeat-containing protein 2 [Scleropages formosus]